MKNVHLLYLLKKVFSNKVVIYLFSRYLTYFLQFISSIIIAVKLGPYYFGIWGFILLLFSYFQITNFGIPNSINILMVQYKNNAQKVKNYVAASIILVGILGVFIALYAIYYKTMGISLFDKFKIGNLFIIVCLIAICVNINNLLMTIYRVKNSIYEVAFYQTIIPVLIFIVMFFAKDRLLLLILLSAYLLGHALSFLLFMKRKLIPTGGKPDYRDAKEILNKGILLFLYNICFYLIIISTRTIVSIYYSIEEFGFFVFSYSMAHSIVLFLDALAFIVFPKLIDKLNSNDPKQVEDTIKAIRLNYISLSHGLIYIALIVFPLFLHFIPKYQGTLASLNLIALVILLPTNFFGYNSFLMARNQDKTIATISVISLIANVGIALGLIYFFHTTYIYVVFAPMFSYLLFSYLCTFYAKKLLNQNTNFFQVLFACFPLKLMVPYIVAVLVVILGFQYLVFLPFIVFVLLNYSTIQVLRGTIKKMVLKPNFINIE
jgi:O-antigen/teichoic acid export membrane protein